MENFTKPMTMIHAKLCDTTLNRVEVQKYEVFVVKLKSGNDNVWLGIKCLERDAIKPYQKTMLRH